MRYLIRLSNLNARYRFPVSSSTQANRIPWRSTCYGLLAQFFILVICAASHAYAREIGSTNALAPAIQGSSGNKAVIEVRTSASAYLPGPAIKIEVTSTKPITTRVTEFLRLTIEQTLLRNDPRLRLARSASDTLIVCSITDLGMAPGIETRTRQEYQQTGLTTVTDPQTGVTRYEPQYSYVDVPFRALVLEARMAVKCDVSDVSTGILLYSDRFDAVYTEAREVGFNPGAQSVDDLNRIYLKLAENAAGLILARLSPRVYSQIVALPSGKLKEAGELMVSGHWTEALTLLTNTPAFKNPKDDAYRVYSIGVAHEALAYKSLDPAEKKRELQLAVDNFQRAVELKPAEDMFWTPKYRAEAELLQTSELVAQVQVFEEARKAGLRPVPTPDPSGANAGLFRQTTSRVQPSPLTIDNQTILQWVKSGRSADYIAASIKHAPETRFDLSEAEVLKLRRAGVNKSVLKAMAKSQPGYYPGFGRTRAVIMAVSMLWWLPWVFVR